MTHEIQPGDRRTDLVIGFRFTVQNPKNHSNVFNS